MTNRLLFVHAHPDDETLTCGVTMASHVAAGDDVHVLTCTLGEEGEVIPRELAHLEGHPDDLLGEHRLGELRRALRAVGATGHILGAEPGRRSKYRDSGMAGSPAAARHEAFVNADLDTAASEVATVVDEVGADVVITYDAFGGYEHPDHIQTHRVTRRALELLAGRRERAELPRVFEIRTPRSWAEEDREWLQHLPLSAGHKPPLHALPMSAPYAAGIVPDAEVTHAVVDPAAKAAKKAAMKAHETQIIVASDDVHALSNLIAARSTDREGFTEVDPVTWHPLTSGPPVEGLLTD